MNSKSAHLTSENLFSDEIGETFTAWLNNLRLDKAVELMRTTDLTVREIAMNVGYVQLELLL